MLRETKTAYYLTFFDSNPHIQSEEHNYSNCQTHGMYFSIKTRKLLT